jgi:hypothetical protein
MTKQEKAKDLRLRREFHITLEQYNQVLAYQNGACAICGKTHNKKGKKLILSVDHDHKTGQVRGLLCWPCNKAIAIFQDDLDRLRGAVRYFEQVPFTVVLGKEMYTAPGQIGAKKRIKQLAVFNAARKSNGAAQTRQKGRKSSKKQKSIR